jgi:hypothetical protein
LREGVVDGEVEQLAGPRPQWELALVLGALSAETLPMRLRGRRMSPLRGGATGSPVIMGCVMPGA